jgi:chemotaxis signal transduction protein
MQLLAFDAATIACAIDLARVREVLDTAPATRVPGAPAGIPGVVAVRGEVLPLVDVAARLGLAPRADVRTALVIVDGPGDVGACALRVDRVTGMEEVAASAVSRPEGPLAAADAVLGVAVRDAGMLVVLDLDRLLAPDLVARGSSGRWTPTEISAPSQASSRFQAPSPAPAPAPAPSPSQAPSPAPSLSRPPTAATAAPSPRPSSPAPAEHRTPRVGTTPTFTPRPSSSRTPSRPHRPPSPSPPTRPSPAPTPRTISPAPTPPTRSADPVRRWPLVAGALALACAALVVVTVRPVLHDRPSAPPPAPPPAPRPALATPTPAPPAPPAAPVPLAPVLASLPAPAPPPSAAPPSPTPPSPTPPPPPPPPSAPPPPPAITRADPGPEVVVSVARGDSLWRLARVHLGNPRAWPAIHALNRAHVLDPDLVSPGQRLVLPATPHPRDARR